MATTFWADLKLVLLVLKIAALVQQLYVATEDVSLANHGHLEYVYCYYNVRSVLTILGRRIHDGSGTIDVP